MFSHNIPEFKRPRRAFTLRCPGLIFPHCRSFLFLLSAMKFFFWPNSAPQNAVLCHPEQTQCKAGAREGQTEGRCRLDQLNPIVSPATSDLLHAVPPRTSVPERQTRNEPGKQSDLKPLVLHLERPLRKSHVRRVYTHARWRQRALLGDG